MTSQHHPVVRAIHLLRGGHFPRFFDHDPYSVADNPGKQKQKDDTVLRTVRISGWLKYERGIELLRG